MFSTYLELGFDHILDLKAYDHILFVVVLCAAYRISQWKNILILVTAFTIGHCITLVLAGFNLINIEAKLVELLIPITILITAIFNILTFENTNKRVHSNYVMAMFFGLIHGLGFSNFFKALLSKDESIVSVLLPFNIGVELGQLVIVAGVFVIGFVFLEIFKLKQKYWTYGLSVMAALVSVYLFINVWNG